MNLLYLYQQLDKIYPILDPHHETWDLWLKPDKEEKEFFEVAIGTILVQNTSWKNVNKAISNLFSKGIDSFEKLLSIDLEELKTLITPAGFYNQKSKYLMNLSEFITTNTNPTRKELLKIKGVGKETADSLLTYCYHIPVPIVGAYTRRFFARFNNEKTFLTMKYEKIQELIAKGLPNTNDYYGRFHALIVVHCQNICLKKQPLCNKCQLVEYCNFDNNNILKQTNKRS